MNNDISTDRKRGVVTGFFGFDAKVLEIMKNDVGISLPISKLRLLQKLYQKNEKRCPALDELYFFDALTAGRSLADIGISRFETESASIAEIYADILSKYSAFSHTSMPSPLSLASVMGRYCERVGKITPQIAVAAGSLPITRILLGGASLSAKTDEAAIGIPSKKRRTGRAGDILVLLCKHSGMQEQEFDNAVSHILSGAEGKFVTDGRVIGGRGLAPALMAFCGGANIDMSALPSIAPPYELDELARAAVGGVVISVKADGVRPLLAAAYNSGIYSSVLGNITSDARLTLRRDYTPPISITMATLRAAVHPAPAAYTLPTPARKPDSGIAQIIYSNNDRLLLSSVVQNNCESPFFAAYDAVLNSLSGAVAAGADYQNILLSLEYELTSEQNDISLADTLSAILGAYRPQIEFYIADKASRFSISKDGKIHIRVAAAAKVNTETPRLPSSGGVHFYLLEPQLLSDGQLDLASLRCIWNKVALLRREGLLCSAAATGGQRPSDILCKQADFIPDAFNMSMLDKATAPASIIVGTKSAIDGVLLGGIL